MRGIFSSSQIANEERRLRDEVTCPRSPGVPVIPCLLSTSFCIFPWLCSVSQGSPPWKAPAVASRKIWLMGIYDRKLEVRRGEAAVSPLFLPPVLSLTNGFMYSVPQVPAK